MNLAQSTLALIASFAVIFLFSMKDKKSGVDNSRVIIGVAGIMAMMSLFFFLVNLLVAFGVLK